LAALTSPSGAAEPRHYCRRGAEVITIPGRYCTCTLILGPAAVAAVDVSSTTDVERILLTLTWLERPLDQLRLVIPSHLHFDHVLGVELLARRTGAAVALGEVAWDHVRGQRPLRWPSRITLLRALPTWAMQGLPLPPAADLLQARRLGFPWTRNRFAVALAPLLADGEALSGLPGWRMLATPGHADEAICLHHAEAGFLVAGDTVRNFFGGEWNPLASSPSDYRQTQARLRRCHVETIFPAHGPVIEGPDPLGRVRELPPWCP
jgi:glyoxylase-like metal-dependent hydrolase (beta-lactamase superfamily II)